MNKITRAGILVGFLLGLSLGARAEVELNELATKDEFSAGCSGYGEARDAGHRLLEENSYVQAATSFEKASGLTPFAIVRARHLANTAYAWLLAGEASAGEISGEGTADGKAETGLKKALEFVAKAEKMAEGLESGHKVNLDELLLHLGRIKRAAGERLDKFAGPGK
jgi:hypothetical protein